MAAFSRASTSTSSSVRPDVVWSSTDSLTLWIVVDGLMQDVAYLAHDGACRRLLLKRRACFRLTMMSLATTYVNTLVRRTKWDIKQRTVRALKDTVV